MVGYIEPTIGHYVGQYANRDRKRIAARQTMRRWKYTLRWPSGSVQTFNGAEPSGHEPPLLSFVRAHGGAEIVGAEVL